MILRKFRMYFDLSLFGFCLSALSLLYIPTVTFGKDQKVTVSSIIIALAFWLGLAVGTVFLKLSTKTRKVIELKLQKNNSGIFEAQRPGVITFFSNKEAKIVDIILAALVAGLTIASVQIEWLMIACLVILLLSFIFHSFLNGKNYKYIVDYKKYLEQKERMKNE